MAGFQWLWKRLVSAPTWQDKLSYLWRPAEWQHGASEVKERVLARSDEQPT